MELASDHHANHGPRGVPERARDLDRCAREVALQSVLVEEHSAVVLGDHVEVLRQGTVGDETCPFLHADYVPWAVEVACQRTRVRSPRWAAGWVDRNEGQADQNDKASEGVAPAREAGLLDTPSIHPTSVILAIRRERIVGTEWQRTVHCAKSSQTAICIGTCVVPLIRGGGGCELDDAQGVAKRLPL